MSFFNFGPSPTKSADGCSQQGANSDFNMFGSSSSASMFGALEDNSGGSFFAAGPGSGDPGTSIFNNSGFGTPMKLGEQKAAPASAMCGQAEDNSTPAKKRKTVADELVSPPATMPGINQPQHYSHRPASGQIASQMPPDQAKPKPVTQSYPPTISHTQVSLGNSQQASPETKEGFTPGQATSMMKSRPSSVQSSVRKEEKGKTYLSFKKGEEDDIAAGAVFKDLIDMQKQQLCELLPKMREGEEKTEQILDSARLVLKDVSNYGEKLAGMKQQYCSRLNKVSSFLRMIPKSEN